MHLLFAVLVINQVEVRVRISRPSVLPPVPSVTAFINLQPVPVNDFKIKSGHKYIIHSIPVWRENVRNERHHINVF